MYWIGFMSTCCFDEKSINSTARSCSNHEKEIKKQTGIIEISNDFRERWLHKKYTNIQ